MSGYRLYHRPVPIGPNRHPADQIRDAEAFCRRYLDQALKGFGMTLLPHRPHDYDDSLTLLVAHLWRLSLTFDPERNDSFANYARTIIPRRAVDVGPRRLLGRNGHRANDYLHEELDETPHGNRPDTPLPDEPGSPDPHWGTDDPGLLAHRDSRRAWAASVLGVGTTGRAA